MNDGGPAFSRAATHDSSSQKGMPLRAWLAGQALPGLLTDLAFPEDNIQDRCNKVGTLAVLIADATIVALNKEVA